MGRGCNKRGQAVTEMALFGGLILTILASFLSYIQQQNEKQYLQMEAFRRALYTAETYTDSTSKKDGQGAGCSSQYTVIQHRRLADGYGRRNGGQAFSASSSVYWAVPYADEDYSAGTAVVYKVNDKVGFIRTRDYVTKDLEDTWEFRVEDMSSGSQGNFDEKFTKLEDEEAIINKRETTMKETVYTKIPYTVRKTDDNDGIGSNDPVSGQGVIIETYQRLYRNTNTGQLEYSDKVPADNYQGVKDSRTWRTEF